MPEPRSAPSAAKLLAWYDRHRRGLPWRAPPGAAADPYRVWLSEIMLQQTTVAAVIPYYEKFLTLFPDVRSLADAPVEAVLRAWAGLGYYARARNLHACARAVAAADGRFPDTPEGLRALPGIGGYTASAIAAIAFGVPSVPVDGNVLRVASRLFAIAAPLPGANRAIAVAAASLGGQTPARTRAGDFAQALFDLGATICTPKAPACGLCPWVDACAGRRAGIAETLPRRGPRVDRPIRYGAHFWLTDAGGCVLLRRRPPHGLLGGMTEFPGTPWRASPWSAEEARGLAPAQACWHRAGAVRHVFTHFALRIDLFTASLPRIEADGFLLPIVDLPQAALPSLMRKCARLAGAIVSGGKAPYGAAAPVLDPPCT